MMIPALKETKSVSNPSVSTPLAGFFNFLGAQGLYGLQKVTAIRYYDSAMPVSDAIDRVAEEFSALQPVLYDTVKEEYINQHPVLDLLKNPSADSTLSEFLTRLCSFYLITGETYVLATGPVNKPPLELSVVGSQFTTLLPDSQDGFLGTIQVTADKYNDLYIRQEVNGRFRFYDDEETGELAQIKSFNPKNSSSVLHGRSKLQPIISEIEQYVESGIHNVSLLKRGARPSGVFSTDSELSDDQFEKLREQVDNWYSGAANAGRPILLENGKGYTEAIVNNRDMDFLNLKMEVTAAIYNQLRIPLPLIKSESMTYSNMQTAKLSLYDNAVIPLANRLFQELSLLLLPRYGKDNTNLIITYDAPKIQALALRTNEQVKLRKEIGANTINELRDALGDDSIEGGDDVLAPATLVPVAELGLDDNADDEAQGKPKPKPKDGDDDESNLKNKYIEIMRAQCHSTGERKYTDTQIIEQILKSDL